jgi:tetratricopeptide (TPR) repeat protein
MIVGALLVSLTGLNAYRANGEIWYALSAYPAGRADELVARSSAALALDPGRADYWNYRGLGREQKQQIGPAAADFVEATTRAPYQVNYFINLARARTAQALAAGDTSGSGAAAALEAARRATAVEPNLSTPHRAYAETALALGRYDLAVQEALRALRLWELDPRTDVVLAAAATKLPDKGAAERVLLEAVALKDTAPLWAGLAQVRLDLGDIAGARAAASHALLLDATNADAKRLLTLASETRSP